MALGRKTGGRQKGARNRATTEARAVAEATGILPLDYMLSVMRDANADPKRRDGMAIAAAPYLHSKLSTVEASEVPHHDANSAEAVGIQVVFVKSRQRNREENEKLLNGHKFVEDPVNLHVSGSGRLLRAISRILRLNAAGLIGRILVPEEARHNTRAHRSSLAEPWCTSAVHGAFGDDGLNRQSFWHAMHSFFTMSRERVS